MLTLKFILLDRVKARAVHSDENGRRTENQTSVLIFIFHQFYQFCKMIYKRHDCDFVSEIDKVTMSGARILMLWVL